MVAGLVIKRVYQLAQVGAITATEKFAFQQPPKYKQQRCILTTSQTCTVFHLQLHVIG